MFHRQRTILELLRLAGGELDRLVLTKWAFLVRHDPAMPAGSAFYDFVPYQYGPFSFGLYHELQKLVAQGYVREVGTSTWGLGREAAVAIDPKWRRQLEASIAPFRRMSFERLLDHVYENYPQYTVNSRRKQLAERRVAPPAVYTAGYEAESIDGFLNRLISAGIGHLVDVRANPIARRYGFHRSTLERLTGRLNIRYSHVPSLGISSAMRRSLETRDDYDRLFARYEATTLRAEHTAIDTLGGWMRESPTVLVCQEADPACCHRARLAVLLSKLTDLPIKHLR